MKKIGIIPLGRSTFDINFANTKLNIILEKLTTLQNKIIGPKELLLDEETTLIELEKLKQLNPEIILVLQITFTDASTILNISNEFNTPISIWAIPEPRLGERLRLNSFCGLNLASHTLGLNKINFNWLYKDPKKVTNNDLIDLFNFNKSNSSSLKYNLIQKPSNQSKEIFKKINSFKIAKIGEKPEGFSTCDYNQTDIQKFCAIQVDDFKLNTLFKKSKTISPSIVKNKVLEISKYLSKIKSVDQEQLRKSIALKFVLDEIKNSSNYNAFAIRCWPEMFTEYGGAICGPVSMMTEGRIPCACEADVYGAISQLIMQTVSQSEVFLTDIVDIDINDNTGVVWHCGQAPISMCEPSFKPQATIHTNRKMPLLFEFPLKEGEVTLMRISKGLGEHKIVISSGEMIKKKMAFTGTSGTIKFNNSANNFLNNLINSGLEHHMVLAYGNHKKVLSEVAQCMGLPVLEI